MSDNTSTPRSVPVSTPNKHQQALMIWLAVFLTLTILNVVLGD